MKDKSKGRKKIELREKSHHKNKSQSAEITTNLQQLSTIFCNTKMMHLFMFIANLHKQTRTHICLEDTLV